MLFLCVERSAGERLLLQKTLENALVECRSGVGHLPNLEFIPASKEEALFRIGSQQKGEPLRDNRNRELTIIFGPGISPEDLTKVATEIRENNSEISLFAILPSQLLSLRNLRKFERLRISTLSDSDSSSRIVHALLSAKESSASQPRGKLISVVGVKGGVGASSVVSGLAHAAHAEGKSALIVDLSPEGALLHYLNTQRWHSSDYRAVLTDGVVPSKSTLERSTVRAPNGIELLLPPSGGNEIREKWLRDPATLDLNTSLVELALESYDIVIVDISHSEGIFPFALEARADQTIFASSNDPAAIHLLNLRLQKLSLAPNQDRVTIVVSLVSESSLGAEDLSEILDLDGAAKFFTLARDKRAAAWIGTGNSLFTEGGKTLQDSLIAITRSLLGIKQNTPKETTEKIGAKLLRHLKRPKSNPRRALSHPALPEPAIQLTFEGDEQPFILDEIDYQPPQRILNKAVGN